MPLLQHTYKRILLSRMRFIGDVVLTTPLIRSVRDAYPDSYLAYLGEKNAVSLLEHNPNLDELIAFDSSRPSILEQSRVALLLRTRKFDLSIDLFNNPRSALLMYLSGAPVRIGAERKGRGRLYTIQVRDDGEPKPAIEFHNQFIRAAGIEPSSVKTEIFLTEDEKREATLYLRRLGLETDNAARPIIGIHAGASWPAKRWLPGRFAELSDLATSKFHAQVFLTEGPADGEANKAVREGAARAVACAANLPLRQLAALISQCDVFVSNDAGPMHIAVAVGTPTIGIFGPGEENIWFPYPRQDGHRALRKDVFCHPCHLDFCNRKGEGYMECMKLLDVAEVFAAVEGLVRTRQRQSLR